MIGGRVFLFFSSGFLDIAGQHDMEQNHGRESLVTVGRARGLVKLQSEV